MGRFAPELTMAGRAWREEVVVVVVGVEVLRVVVGTKGEQLGWLGRPLMPLLMLSSMVVVTPLVARAASMVGNT